ncbi:type II toxin-antitoxin system VapB family antitoxin [Streptosporangiaceae bacterium NEAU-GS5]|nr:type II toxin-antitoxin system VapB family antitoxin [Streptosporangiaceae bacterium NEAU-GS5]
MKTTVEISDALLEEAKLVARREGTTLRSLIEEGLRAVLARRETTVDYVLEDAAVGGRGLQFELQGASWEEIRAMAYGDRL